MEETQFELGVREGRREAADLVLESLGRLPAGTTMATKDMLLDLYNELTQPKLDTEDKD